MRERIWTVLENGFLAEKDASIVLLWQDANLPGGQSVKTLDR